MRGSSTSYTKAAFSGGKCDAFSEAGATNRDGRRAIGVVFDFCAREFRKGAAEKQVEWGIIQDLAGDKQLDPTDLYQHPWQSTEQLVHVTVRGLHLQCSIRVQR